MKVYVQGDGKLIPLQSEVTADSIENALGYTPADAETVEDISTADDTAFYIVDKDQNIIAKIDAEGVKAAVMTVNGKDVESGLVTDEDRESWGGSDLDDVISKEDDSTLYVTDKDGNIIAKIDKDGLHTTDVYIGDESGEQSVEDMITEAVADIEPPDISGKLETSTFEAHEADLDKHLGGDISTKNDEALYICDKDGNIIARFDGDGLDITDLKIGSIPFTDHIEALVEGETPCTHEYVTIQELTRDTEDCTTWKDLQYCSSCGKVHANPVHSGHDLVTVAAQEPTYSSIGWNEYQYCTRCDYSTYEELPMKIAKIKYTLKNCTAFGGPTICPYGQVVRVSFGADAYATAPDDVIVTNCDYTWDKSTGTLTMSNPTGDIEVTVIYTYSLSITILKLDEGNTPCEIGDYDNSYDRYEDKNSVVYKYKSVIVDRSTPITVKLTSNCQPSEGTPYYIPIVYDGSTGATFSIVEDTDTSDVYTLTISKISTNVTVLISGIISNNNS